MYNIFTWGTRDCGMVTILYFCTALLHYLLLSNGFSSLLQLMLLRNGFISLLQLLLLSNGFSSLSGSSTTGCSVVPPSVVLSLVFLSCVVPRSVSLSLFRSLGCDRAFCPQFECVCLFYLLCAISTST